MVAVCKYLVQDVICRYECVSPTIRTLIHMSLRLRPQKNKEVTISMSHKLGDHVQTPQKPTKLDEEGHKTVVWAISGDQHKG